MGKDTRIVVLAQFLDADVNDISNSYDEFIFSYGKQEYMVLTDEEADEKATEYVKDSLWAFNAEFIASHTKNGLSDKAIRAVRKMQEELCEDANDIVEALVEDLDDFIQDAISADGRGHFLSSYDGQENEEQLGDGRWVYIYRLN